LEKAEHNEPMEVFIALALLDANRRSALVDVRRVVPGIAIDLRYATSRNFTGRPLYPSQAPCLLRRDVAERLALAQKDLKRSGVFLKVWDAYRPLSITRELWERIRDRRYVAPPSKGSRHNRGAAVDVTLVDRHGNDLPMPTDFDDFSARAYRNHRRLSPRQLHNRRLLQEAMERHGFVGLPTEWWHFDAKDWARYPVLDIPFEERTPSPRGAASQ
jgi:D-alanyl-D-alanine dipeptidase